MKDLCSHNCCAVKGAMYVTPWCDMLRGKDSSCSVLHLWYKMDILRQEARKRLAYLGAANGYQNVPDVNDLVGVEPSGTPTPLQLTYTESAMREELRKRLAYLGISNGYQNVPDVNDLVGVEPSGTPTPLQFFFSPSEIQNQAKSMLAYLGAANGYQNIPNIDDLVGTYNSTSGTQLLLSFPLATLKEEIEKKTAYLGKFRRTEEAVHLLDLIAVTDDESELLLSLVKEAVMDVWNILSAPFVAVSKKAWWQESATTTYQVGAHYQFSVNYSTAYDINPLKQAILNALVERIIYKWLLYAYPGDAAQYDTNFQQATAEVQACCKDFKARAANIFAPLAKEAMMDVWNVLSAPFVAVSKKAWWQESATTTYQVGAYYYFDVNYVLTTEEKDALQRILLEAIVARVISKWLVLAYPDEAPKFDTAYQQAIAAIPQRVNEFKARWSGLLVPFAKEAMSEVWNALSAPFVGISKKAWYNSGVQYQFDVNYVLTSNETDSLQHVVLDALASRIIYKWLLASYPDEAPKFDTIYQQAIAAIPQRVNEFKARWSGLLVPFAKEAMSEVWNALSAPFVGITKKAVYDNGIQYLFNVNYVLTANETDSLQHIVLDALASRIIYKWLLASYPDEAQKFDAAYQQAIAAIPQRVNEFKARWSGLFIPFTKAAMADVYAVLNKYMPRHEKSYWFREGRDTVSFDSSGTDPNLLHLSQLSEVDDEGFLIADNIPVDDDGYIRIAETAVDDEGYIISDGSETEPVTFYASQYVIVDGKLYIAIEDGDSSDYIGKIVPTEDYRDSVHYGILWRCQHNINAVEPLDTAIFETLVARIVYKWVAKAYPVEAEAYLAEYNENAERIREFARIMEGPQIVNRIPRMF